MPEEIEKLSEEFETKTPQEIIKWAIDTFWPQIAMSSSFQTQSVPLLHMVSQIDRNLLIYFIDRYFTRYPGVARYMEEARQTARDKGYVETAFGRRLWFPEIRSSQAMRRQGAERAAINAPMQGTAADLIKLAMIAVQNWLEKDNLKTLLIMQVHDELVLEVPEQELTLVKDRLCELMCGVANLKVPLEVGLGEGGNWDEAH